MVALIRDLLNDAGGATAFEYAVVGSAIGLAVAIGAAVLGDDVAALYRGFGGRIDTALTTGNDGGAGAPSGS